MKKIVTLSRILVGALFIFSGLVKAIDPLGLAYKMQEFFEAWKTDGYFINLINGLNNYALQFSIFMITLEVILGIALLIGYKKKLTLWLLFLLTLFFVFLTSYVLFTGKIRACGCFGDCIPLTPIQTFTKDIILSLLIILILVQQKYILPIFKKLSSFAIVLLSLGAVLYLQFYVLNHLPLKDCLPYKIGNNILQLRKTPADATYDKFYYTYFYKKDNQQKEFGMDKLPDSSWTFVQQAHKNLIQKGNGKVPLINDFSLTTLSGNDTTEALLNQPNEYYLLFVKEPQEIKNPSKDWIEDVNFILKANAKNKNIYIVTASPKDAIKRYNLFINGKKPNAPLFTCDGTAIKTAARASTTLFLMNGPVIKNKWAAADISKALF